MSRRVFPESTIRGSLGDFIELSYGPILVLRFVDLVETGRHSPITALAKIAPAMLVR